MAIVVSKVAAGDFTGGSSINYIRTTSQSPTADRTYLAFFHCKSRSAAARTHDSINASYDMGLSWTQIIEHDSAGEGGGWESASLWVASGTASTSELQVDLSDNTSDAGCSWSIYEVADTDQVTDDGVVLTNDDADYYDSGTSVALVLSSFVDATNNAAFLVGWNEINTRTVAGYGGTWSEIHDESTTNGGRLWAAYQVGEDTSCNATLSANSDHMAIAVEIRAATTFTDAVISKGVGEDDITTAIDVDTHDDVNTDHSDLYRHTSSPATGGSVIQNNITPVETDTIVDNTANSTSAPAADTLHYYILRDWEEVGETTDHDSNEISIKTAPARPTGLTEADVAGHSISMSWTDQTSSTHKHRVYYREDGDTVWILDATLAAGDTAHTVQNLDADTLYEWTVAAWNSTDLLESGFPTPQTSLTAQTIEVGGAISPTGVIATMELVQVALPTSDVDIGVWVSTGVSGYTEIDDPVGTPDFGDFVRTLVAGEAQFGLSAVTDPAGNVRHRIFYSLSVQGGTHNVTLRLREGATQRASWSHSSVTGPIVMGMYELTTGEADTIGNYGNLRITVEKT